MADYSIKSIRQDFKNKGIFYTPENLSKFMRNLLPAKVDEIYDPTCGAGNLLSVFGDEVKKYGQDINCEQVEFAKTRLKNFEGVAGDTLKSPAFKGKKFNYIIANYPFSVKWDPFVDDENGLERTVKITEIQENNYCLSVQNYVQKEEIKEKINPLELMKETRNIFYNHLKKELEFEKAVCLLNNWNFYEFVDELQIILNQYKRGKEVNKNGKEANSRREDS